MPAKPLKNLIVADDEENILDIIQYCLEDLQGTTIRYCRSGYEVIEEATRLPPDLILLDFMMPGMDGGSTLSVMRTNPTLAHIPVIFLTAKVQKEEREQYLKMGAADVIAKPFDPMTLADSVRQAWDKVSNSSSILKA